MQTKLRDMYCFKGASSQTNFFKFFIRFQPKFQRMLVSARIDYIENYLLRYLLHYALVSILLIPLETLEGSFRILNLKDPIKFYLGSCFKS